MQYFVKGNQVSYGESIGILLLENFVPYIPGDTANATTYRYPVRFQRVPGLSVAKIFAQDASMYNVVKEAALTLKGEGVRAITGDCGFMALFQQQLSEDVDLPIFLTSLLQLPFMGQIVSKKKTLGVITANNQSLTPNLLRASGVDENLEKRLRSIGLEDDQHFYDAVFVEKGMIDPTLVEKAVVERAVKLVDENPNLGAILLECSMLPPYGDAVYKATKLPVFDYITMIDYVYSVVVKRRYDGYM